MPSSKEILHAKLLERMTNSMKPEAVARVIEKYGHPIAFATIYTEKGMKINEAARSFPAIASTPTQDRIGDIIHSDGWELKSFAPNPMMLWAHKYDELPIGRCENTRVEEGKLKFDASFVPAEIYPFAETVYQMFKGGWLNAFSVGFDPIEWLYNEEIGGMEFMKQALLEISGVPVPMNPEALAERTVQDYLKKGFGVKVCSNCHTAQPPAPVPAIVPAAAAAPEAKAKITPDSIIISPFEFKNIEQMLLIHSIMKSGKVISEKNKAIISECIEHITKSAGALNALLELCQPIEEDKTIDSSKIDAAIAASRKLLAQ